ncbi:RND family efflux transporter MFP subunit [Pacificibacter maritimus]|uniref:RND family efflux transporter MFP subunit n=1 Tax=Pacificibacter maritimus TaxID=762213 RepID=A0A3N4UKG9_9RHOB|nr:efflux RND transporter periplasmic adaptor subunit [Pacificibacter maritimus]RPE71156.1 RND family efflux transporter MFP subunit [Pacificibacter maritimus]
MKAISVRKKIIFISLAAAALLGLYAFSLGRPDASKAGQETAEGQAEAPRDPAAGQRRAGGGGGRQATTVITQPLELLPYLTVLNAMGVSSSAQSVEVVASAAGEVVALDIAANTRVEAGDVLLQQDARTQSLNLEIAQAQLDQATETVARYERLRANGSSTVTDVTLSDARIAQRLAEANVGLAEIALEDRTVRAPIAGKLGQSDVEIGDTLSANSAIVTIDNDAALQVTFELPERAISMLSDVSTVAASTPSFIGRVFDAEILSYDSRLDSVTRSVTVKAQIDNSSGELWPGMTFSVRIEKESEPTAAIASTAVTWSRDGASVWIDAQGKAQQVPITIVSRRDETVWIDADIEEGQPIVTEGAHKLREGAALQAQSAFQPRGERPEQPPRSDDTASRELAPETNKQGDTPTPTAGEDRS